MLKMRSSHDVFKEIEYKVMKKLLSLFMIGYGFLCSAMNVPLSLEELAKEILMNPNHCGKDLPAELSQKLGYWCLRGHPVGEYLRNQSIRGCLGIDEKYLPCWCDDRRRLTQASEECLTILKACGKVELAHFNAAAHKLVTVAKECGDEFKVWDVTTGELR